MKFFTRQWCKGEDSSEAEARSAIATYQVHIDNIASRLTPNVLTLATSISLHDGKVRQMKIDESKGIIDLLLRLGDLQTGYFDLTLRYARASYQIAGSDGLANIVDNPDTEILYDEVDVVSTTDFEHRVIFWPQGEVAIQFSDLSLSRQPAETRAFEAVLERLQTGIAN